MAIDARWAPPYPILRGWPNMLMWLPSTPKVFNFGHTIALHILTHKPVNKIINYAHIYISPFTILKFQYHHWHTVVIPRRQIDEDIYICLLIFLLFLITGIIISCNVPFSWWCLKQMCVIKLCTTNTSHWFVADLQNWAMVIHILTYILFYVPTNMINVCWYETAPNLTLPFITLPVQQLWLTGPQSS